MSNNKTLKAKVKETGETVSVHLYYSSFIGCYYIDEATGLLFDESELDFTEDAE